jgi:hypothetical protein
MGWPGLVKVVRRQSPFIRTNTVDMVDMRGHVIGQLSDWVTKLTSSLGLLRTVC